MNLGKIFSSLSSVVRRNRDDDVTISAPMPRARHNIRLDSAQPPANHVPQSVLNSGQAQTSRLDGNQEDLYIQTCWADACANVFKQEIPDPAIQVPTREIEEPATNPSQGSGERAEKEAQRSSPMSIAMKANNRSAAAKLPQERPSPNGATSSTSSALTRADSPPKDAPLRAAHDNRPDVFMDAGVQTNVRSFFVADTHLDTVMRGRHQNAAVQADSTRRHDSREPSFPQFDREYATSTTTVSSQAESGVRSDEQRSIHGKPLQLMSRPTDEEKALRINKKYRYEGYAADGRTKVSTPIVCRHLSYMYMELCRNRPCKPFNLLLNFGNERQLKKHFKAFNPDDEIRKMRKSEHNPKFVCDTKKIGATLADIIEMHGKDFGSEDEVILSLSTATHRMALRLREDSIAFFDPNHTGCEFNYKFSSLDDLRQIRHPGDLFPASHFDSTMKGHNTAVVTVVNDTAAFRTIIKNEPNLAPELSALKPWKKTGDASVLSLAYADVPKSKNMSTLDADGVINIIRQNAWDISREEFSEVLKGLNEEEALSILTHGLHEGVVEGRDEAGIHWITQAIIEGNERGLKFIKDIFEELSEKIVPGPGHICFRGLLDPVFAQLKNYGSHVNKQALAESDLMACIKSSLPGWVSSKYVHKYGGQ